MSILPEETSYIRLALTPHLTTQNILDFNPDPQYSVHQRQELMNNNEGLTPEYCHLYSMQNLYVFS